MLQSGSMHRSYDFGKVFSAQNFCMIRSKRIQVLEFRRSSDSKSITFKSTVTKISSTKSLDFNEINSSFLNFCQNLNAKFLDWTQTFGNSVFHTSECTSSTTRSIGSCTRPWILSPLIKSVSSRISPLQSLKVHFPIPGANRDLWSPIITD